MGVAASRRTPSHVKRKEKRKLGIASLEPKNLSIKGRPSSTFSTRSTTTPKRPTKREKKRSLRESLEFPSLGSIVTEESRALCVGKGLLRFDGIAEAGPEQVDGSRAAEPSQSEPQVFQSSSSSSSSSSSKNSEEDFISLDLEDESELGLRFRQFEEEEEEEEEAQNLGQNFENEFPCPWMNSETTSVCNTVGHQLTTEVLNFLRYMSPTTTEVNERDRCVQRLRSVVQRLWPNATAEVFGSYATGLYLPDADIDVVVLGDGMSYKIRNEMYKLRASLERNQLAQRVQVIAHARVPIVKYVESSSGYNVDIAFSQNGGIETAARVSRWIAEVPALKPVAMVVRQFLKRKSLSDAAFGGLGGYATICMVYSRIQQLKAREAPNIDLLNNVGLLLIDFFQYYGHEFDNSVEFVRPLEAPNCFPRPKRENGSMNTQKAACLSIEDPNDRDNNISKAAYNYPTVKRSFANAADYLKGLCLKWHKMNSDKRTELSFLAPLLKFAGSEPRRNHVSLQRALSIVKPSGAAQAHAPTNKSAAASVASTGKASMARTNTLSLSDRIPARTDDNNTGRRGRRGDSRKEDELSKKDSTNGEPQLNRSQRRRQRQRAGLQAEHEAKAANEAMMKRQSVEKGKGVSSYDPWTENATEENASSVPSSSRASSKRKISDGRDNEKEEEDDDANDSRTKLTSAQRRQFWHKKAGLAEQAQNPVQQN